MPLKKGKKNIGANIKELHHATKKRSDKQIIAIAMSEAGKSPKKGKSKRK